MDIQTRIQVERLIVKSAMDSLIEQGYSVATYVDNDLSELSTPTRNIDEIMDLLMESDEDTVIVSRRGSRIGTLQFVYGNDGWDVLSDYSTTLEDALQRTGSLAERLQEADLDGTLWQFIDAEKFASELKRQMQSDIVRVSWEPFAGSEKSGTTGALLDVGTTLNVAEIISDDISPTDGGPIRKRRFFPSTFGYLKVLSGPLAALGTSGDEETARPR
mgnify:FL=1